MNCPANSGRARLLYSLWCGRLLSADRLHPGAADFVCTLRPVAGLTLHSKLRPSPWQTSPICPWFCPRSALAGLVTGWVHGQKIAQFLINKSVYLGNGARYGHGCYRSRIGNHTKAIEWWHFRWVTL